jgi:hypothetical protein
MLDIPTAGRTRGAEESLNDIAYRVIADPLIMHGHRHGNCLSLLEWSCEVSKVGCEPIVQTVFRRLG